MPNIENLQVFVKTDNGKIHQVVLSHEQHWQVMNFLTVLFNGEVKCLEKDFQDSITWKDRKESKKEA